MVPMWTLCAWKGVTDVEALMWFGGLFLAFFGPLLLLPIIWVIHRWPLALLDRWCLQVTGHALGWVRPALAAAMVGGVVWVTWWPGYQRYQALCDQYATPNIVERTHLDGFFVSKMFDYEAGRYLMEWGFQWIEAPDPYRAGRLLRYRRTDKGIEPEEVSTITAKAAFIPEFRELPDGIHLSLKRIVRLPDPEAWRSVEKQPEMARAGSVVYHGGPLKIVLGAWGLSTCPSAPSADAIKAFQDYYYLEQRVLRRDALK